MERTMNRRAAMAIAAAAIAGKPSGPKVAWLPVTIYYTSPPNRRGFTMVELLIVMLIIAVLAMLAWGALAGVAEQAKETRTRSIVLKIDQLVMSRWDGYRTRPLPIRIAAGTPPKSEPFVDSDGNGFWYAPEPFTDKNGNGAYDRGAAFYRLMALRELQRCELPERISDLCTAAELADLTADNKLDAMATGAGPLCAMLPTPPATARSMRRKAAQVVNSGSPWTMPHESAECLYLIVSTMQDGDKNALDFFMPGEIGDVDQDGMREILDGWGTPIAFLRWAPGFVGGQVLTMQSHAVPDPFDPVREDVRPTFDLHPLIYSAGADKLFDINVGTPIYSTNIPPNDPYFGGNVVGWQTDSNTDGEFSWKDNISNHWRPTN